MCNAVIRQICGTVADHFLGTRSAIPQEVPFVERINESTRFARIVPPSFSHAFLSASCTWVHMSWYQRALPNSKTRTQQSNEVFIAFIWSLTPRCCPPPTTGLCSIEAKAWKNSPLHFQCQLGTSRQMKISILSSKDVNDCMYIIQFVILGEKTCTQATQHVISTHFVQFIISTEPNRNHDPVTGSGRRSRSARSRASFSCCNFKMASWNHGSPRKDHRMYITTKDFEPRKMEERAMSHLYVYKQIWRYNCMICTYRYLEPIDLYFRRSTPPKQGLFSNQNKGHLGSRMFQGIEICVATKACDCWSKYGLFWRNWWHSLHQKEADQTRQSHGDSIGFSRAEVLKPRNLTRQRKPDQTDQSSCVSVHRFCIINLQFTYIYIPTRSISASKKEVQQSDNYPSTSCLAKRQAAQQQVDSLVCWWYAIAWLLLF